MVPLRVALLSACLLAVCTAAAFWTVHAVERMMPRENRAMLASVAYPSSEVADGLDGRAAKVRSVESMIARMRTVIRTGSADYDELWALSDAAARFGESAIDPLGKVARGAGEPIGLRLLAVEMLGRIEEPSVSILLIECLQTSKPEKLRLAALAALGVNETARERSEVIVFELMRADASPSVRASAAEILCRDAGATAAGPLSRTVLADTDPVVRISAATSLGVILDPVAIPALCEAARVDRDAGVRAAAIEAVGNYKDATLREFFQKIETTDPDQQVRAAARRQGWRLPQDND